MSATWEMAYLGVRFVGLRRYTNLVLECYQYRYDTYSNSPLFILVAMFGVPF
jgi:hypothetical protein